MYIYLAGKPILPLQFELKLYEKELPPYCRKFQISLTKLPGSSPEWSKHFLALNKFTFCETGWIGF